MRVVNIDVLGEVWREDEGELSDVHQINGNVSESVSRDPVNLLAFKIFPCIEELSLVSKSSVEGLKILTEENELHNVSENWECEIEMFLHSVFLNFNKFELVELLWLLINIADLSLDVLVSHSKEFNFVNLNWSLLLQQDSFEPFLLIGHVLFTPGVYLILTQFLILPAYRDRLSSEEIPSLEFTLHTESTQLSSDYSR